MAAGCADLTRSAAQKLIGSGGVGVNGVPHDAGHIVRAGDWIEVNQPDPVDDTLRPEAIVLDVLYEDADVLVINKPAGMVVHPGAGVRGGTVANAILSYAPETADAGDIHAGLAIDRAHMAEGFEAVLPMVIAHARRANAAKGDIGHATLWLVSA